MKRTSRLAIATILFLASSLWSPWNAIANTPARQLQETWEQIVVVLKSARFDSAHEIDAFRTKVMQVITPRFDFAEMAKLCLGAHWQARTREERDEFTALLTATLARSYIGGMRSYQDSTVLFTREFSDENSAEVDTKIVGNSAKDVSVNYKMHLVEENWKVYDVIIDDISLIGNFRAQFHRVIAQSSFAGLIRLLKEKQQS